MKSEIASCSVVSDSLRPHGLWSDRLLCPWDPLGKNTGVDCHSLFHGIFPTQGSNPHPISLLHCRWILHRLDHQKSSPLIWNSQNISQEGSDVSIKVNSSFLFPPIITNGLLWWLSSKESTCNTGDIGDVGLIPGSGWTSGGGNGNLFQYSFLGNPHGQRSLAGYSPWSCKVVYDLGPNNNSTTKIWHWFIHKWNCPCGSCGIQHHLPRDPKESRPPVYRVIGWQTSVPAVDPAVACEPVPALSQQARAPGEHRFKAVTHRGTREPLWKFRFPEKKL